MTTISPPPTWVGSVERIKNVARRVAKWKAAGHDLVVVPSAMAGETNRLIARFAPQFPITLNPGAADYGLLFILASGKHFVLVSSGLPWWTGAEEANRGGYRFAPGPYRLLSTFGDYILFKGSLANVLAEGRFDRNGKVAPEVAEKLRATGTVTILR